MCVGSFEMGDSVHVVLHCGVEVRSLLGMLVVGDRRARELSWFAVVTCKLE
jgi:hypothetical protein